MPQTITITLPEDATAEDARAIESLLRRALPQAAVLVTFMGAGLSSTAQARTRSILPRAKVGG